MGTNVEAGTGVWSLKGCRGVEMRHEFCEL